MAAYSQDEHLLKIETILPNPGAGQSDPLLLVKLDGVEGISRLFAYDLIMLHDESGTTPIDPTKLIGTHAVISARPSSSKRQEDGTIWRKRVGMFETFEDLFSSDFRTFRVYRARVVPWVKVLSRDICYRVFEGKTVVEIIEAIKTEAEKTFTPHLKIDTSGLKNPSPPFAPIDYCVQFGESTLDFLFRIMARFGIWYFFGHDATGPTVLNDKMFLKGHWDRQAPVCGRKDVTIVDHNPTFEDISKVVRRFRPPERRVAVGGFNYINPTKPFYKDGTVDSSEDLLKGEGGSPSQTKWAGSTAFAEPVFNAEPDTKALSETVTSQNQSEVVLISGATINNTFISGHSFHINQGKNDNEQKPYFDLVDHDFIIDALAITANDYKYWNFGDVVSTAAKGGLPGVLRHTHELFVALEANALDMTNNSLRQTSLWATKTAEAKIYSAINRSALDPTNPPPATSRPARGSDGDPLLDPTNPPPPGQIFWTPEVNVAQYISLQEVLDWEQQIKSIPLIGPVIGHFLPNAEEIRAWLVDQANLATFAVGVIAVPMYAQATDGPVDLPLPVAARPVARGPHTAVVIGPDDGKGVDTSEHDLYFDAIGRVRIRFPWDPGPPQGGSDLPPVFPFTESDKPTKVGGNTCWVRVVEGWAGRHYGLQFLPRIGQEVIVDFLDGDPERPVIVGRLYNADHGTTNLPFPYDTVKDTQIDKLSDLPATKRYDLPYSGIKTWSIPTSQKGANGDPTPLPDRYHLLRFDDTRGKEQYLIRSQHRLDITALEKRYESISSDRHLTVGGMKLTPPPKEIGGDYIARVFRHYYLHVGDVNFPTQSGNRTTLLEQNDVLHAQGDSTQEIDGNWTTYVGQQITIDAVGVQPIVIQGHTNISLVVGESSIVITPASIAITSPSVLINSGGPPPAKGLVVQLPLPLEPIAADPGDKLIPPE